MLRNYFLFSRCNIRYQARMRTLWGVAVAILIGLTACAGQAPMAVKPSAVTPGMAKKFIYSGKTTQADVLEIFGPPNIVTHKNGREVWTYDRISQEVTNSGGFLTILIAGYEKNRHSSATRSTMLIIYFNGKDVVQDYALSAAQF